MVSTLKKNNTLKISEKIAVIECLEKGVPCFDAMKSFYNYNLKNVKL